jgi:hypothetical protein
MSDQPLKQVPSAAKLEREARRLARIRHLSLVPEASPERLNPAPARLRDQDPEPRPAA